MHTQALALRKTQGYVGTYRHLDQWEELGTVEEIGREDITPEEIVNDIEEPVTIKRYLIVDAPTVGEEAISRALRDTFTSLGCAHEYDCCGCRSYYVTKVNRRTGDLWEVTIHSSRNY